MNKPIHPFNVRHRDIAAIALPATLAFITEPLVGIVDIVIIGRLGNAGLLGAIELGAVGFDLLFATAYFLRLGTAGLVAQSVGAQEADGGFVHLMRAGLMAIGLGLLLLLLSPLIQNAALVLFAPPGNGVSMPFLTYLQVRIWSAPFVLLNFVFLGWFYGHGAAKTGMALQIFLNLANVGISIWMVYGLKWGVAGAAGGTVAAEVLTVLVTLGVIYFQTARNTFIRIFTSGKLLEINALWRLLDLSRDLMIRSVLISGSFAFFSAQMSRTGEMALASSAVLLNFMLITAFFLDGQAQAAEFYCGKAIGANYRPAFIRSWYLSSFWGLVVGFGLFVFWLVAGPVLVDVITTNETVRLMARDHLFVASFIAFTGVLAFVMDGVITGATLNNLLYKGMIVSSIIYVISSVILQNLFGLTGLWISLHVFFVVRGIIFWIAVKRRLPVLFDD